MNLRQLEHTAPTGTPLISQSEINRLNLNKDTSIFQQS